MRRHSSHGLSQLTDYYCCLVLDGSSPVTGRRLADDCSSISHVHEDLHRHQCGIDGLTKTRTKAPSSSVSSRVVQGRRFIFFAETRAPMKAVASAVSTAWTTRYVAYVVISWGIHSKGC
jgi:hypothetical protein